MNAQNLKMLPLLIHNRRSSRAPVGFKNSLGGTDVMIRPPSSFLHMGLAPAGTPYYSCLLISQKGSLVPRCRAVVTPPAADGAASLPLRGLLGC